MSENDGTQDSAHVFTHNAGSVSQLPLWPQTHFIFINLFVVRFISPNGRDYSNLAWNASTSYVVTPFCNFQPPKGSRHEPHRLVHLHVLFILPNGDICLNLCLKQAFCTAPGACTLLIKAECEGRRLWDDPGLALAGTLEKLMIWIMAWVFRRALGDLFAGLRSFRLSDSQRNMPTTSGQLYYCSDYIHQEQ